MNPISPLRGWRYDPGIVNPNDVAAPPYDVIDPEEQLALYAKHDRNVIRLILGRQFPTTRLKTTVTPAPRSISPNGAPNASSSRTVRPSTPTNRRSTPAEGW